MPLGWKPQRPRFRLLPLLLTWLIVACSVLVVAAVLPSVSVPGFGRALAAAAVIAVLNALLLPIAAARRLPWTIAIGFVGVLMIDALILLLASHLTSRAIHVDSFGWALLCALVITAAPRRRCSLIRSLAASVAGRVSVWDACQVVSLEER